MIVFISGGCKNGKSSIAEDICVKLANGNPLYYLATMKAFDDEDRDRIRRHIKSRDGKNFITIEQPNNILEALDKFDAKNATVLLDSVTALMINELYPSMENCETEEIKEDKDAANRVALELSKLSKSVKNIVFVSDYIYEETDNYSEFTQNYLSALSTVDKALAKIADLVLEVKFGNTIVYKGELI